MFADDRFRPLRATLRNAVVWGIGWALAGLAVFATLRLTGILSRGSLLDGLGLAVRFGVWGGLAGVVFSSFIRFVYRGRRLADISWVRFGLAGGVLTGVLVPLALQALNLLSGDGLVAWSVVTDDAVLTALFGAVAAGGSLKLAQMAEALASRREPGRLGPADRGQRGE
jgi:hypothetical protein